MSKDENSAGIGHNSGDTMIGGIAADALRQGIERIENLEEEKSNIASDIKDVYAQMKSQGFDTKIVRQIVRLRKMDDADRSENFQLLELYGRAIGIDIFG